MPLAHNAFEQANLLNQIVSLDKLPISILIGAGCPLSVRIGTEDAKEPLIPDVAGLTAIIQTRVDADPALSPLYTSLIRQVEKPDGSVNIEDILGHLRTLQVAAGSAEARGFTADQLKKLDEKICQLIVEITDKPLPPEANSFLSLARWTRSTRRDHPVELFTTNYDLLLEQALESEHTPFFDGFIGSKRAFFDPFAIDEDRLPPRWARLWKLHGSINWVLDADEHVYRVNLPDKTGVSVIHPSHLKYDEIRRMPYLAMIDRLRAFFRLRSAVMITCGYSFQDKHLNEIIYQGLQANPHAALYGLLYDRLDRYESAATLGEKQLNASIIAKDSATIGGRKAPWATGEPPGLIAAGIASTVRSTAEGEEKKNEFLLGDFAQFGTFLADAIGTKIPFGDVPE